MTKSLLLEVGLEEIPAKYVTSSRMQLKERVVQFLNDNYISFSSITDYATPRRLAVIVENVATTQRDVEEVFKGPSKQIALDDNGNWTKAAVGFVTGKGLHVDDIYFETIKDVEYVHVKKITKGQDTANILKGLEHVILSMTFPITMTWGDYHLKYIRPIHWIVAQFGHDTIDFNILDVATDTITRGHRFLGQDTVVSCADEYVDKLKEQYVIVSPDDRRQMIVSQIEALAKQHQWVVDIDEALLEEVVNIVEYPTAFFGQFDDKYLVVPDDVLITTMKEHQRYFYVKNSDGKLLPYFISVRNGNNHHIENVVKGNEKVLVARLEDALFFTNEDAKIKIDEAVEKLERVNFHVKIGSMAQKMANTKQIVSILCEALQINDEHVLRASDIYKFDLVTNMVGEFPELQGVMGEKYALDQGETVEVAQAIREHYMPLSSDGKLPSTQAGTLLSLADKIDTLLSFFNIGVIPSGSNDPYALRRTAIGIVRLLEENYWALDIDELFSLVLNDVYGLAYDNQHTILEQLHHFMSARVQQQLQLDNVRHDIIQAALTIDVFSIPFIMENARELQAHVNDEQFKDVIEAVTRVVNMFDKSAEIDFEFKPFDVTLAQSDSEKALNDILDRIEDVTYDAFVTLTPYITAFFNDNMVFVDDVAIRNNRLCLIADCAQLILYYMDPTKIVK